jgi:translocation and assembly module TamA
MVSRFLALAAALCCCVCSADVLIEGVGDELENNVRAYVSLAAEPCDAETGLVRRRFRSIEREARSALEPFGYYEPSVGSTLELGEDCWQATLNIDAGKPVTLREVDVSLTGPGADDPILADLLTSKTLTPGSQLRHSYYESLKQALQIASAERGYVEADFLQNSIEVWPEQQAADVSLHLESGARYNFGVFTLEQDFLDPELINGYIDVEPGQPYDNRLLIDTYRDLSTSGYFSRVDVMPEIDVNPDKSIPVHIALEPSDRIEYTVGVGFSTDTGPRLRAGYRNQRVNREGHRIIGDATFSSVLQGITAEYRKPLSNPRRDWMSYTGALTHEDTDTFESDTVRLGLRRSKQLRASWLRTLSLDASYDNFEVGVDSNETLLILPAVAFDHKDADRELYPNRGRRLVVELRGTDELLGSDTSFIQVTAHSRWIRALSAKSRLVARASIGFTAESDFDELPPSVRFFAGGDESIRGFGLDTLGPKDEDGNVIGGSSLLIASIEYERQMRGNFYGAAFVDAGNAFEDLDVDAAIGVGLGLIWRSPVGPVRVYLAHPLNKSDNAVRVHLRLGLDL